MRTSPDPEDENSADSEPKAAGEPEQARPPIQASISKVRACNKAEVLFPDDLIKVALKFPTPASEQLCPSLEGVTVAELLRGHLSNGRFFKHRFYPPTLEEGEACAVKRTAPFIEDDGFGRDTPWLNVLAANALKSARENARFGRGFNKEERKKLVEQIGLRGLEIVSAFMFNPNAQLAGGAGSDPRSLATGEDANASGDHSYHTYAIVKFLVARLESSKHDYLFEYNTAIQYLVELKDCTLINYKIFFDQRNNSYPHFLEIDGVPHLRPYTLYGFLWNVRDCLYESRDACLLRFEEVRALRYKVVEAGKHFINYGQKCDEERRIYEEHASRCCVVKIKEPAAASWKSSLPAEGAEEDALSEQRSPLVLQLFAKSRTLSKVDNEGRVVFSVEIEEANPSSELDKVVQLADGRIVYLGKCVSLYSPELRLLKVIDPEDILRAKLGPLVTVVRHQFRAKVLSKIHFAYFFETGRRNSDPLETHCVLLTFETATS